MNTDYLKEHLNYDSRGESLNEISKEQLTKMLIDYYFNSLTLSKLIKKYNLNTKPTNLRADFPNLDSDIKCPYDNNLMIKKMPPKDAIRFNNIDKDDFECVLCGHMDSINCRCDNCRKYYKEKISKYYTHDNENPIELNKISLMDRLNLAEILQINHAQSIKDIIAYNDLDSYKYYKLVSHLLDENLILVSPNSPIESFKITEKFPRVFYPSEIMFDINVNSSFETLKFIKDDVLDKYDFEEIKNVCKSLVMSELLRLLITKMNEYSLKFVSNNENESNNIEDVESLFNRMLKTMSPGQIYNLIWRGTRDANDAKTRNKWGNYKYHHLKFVLLNMDKIWKSSQNNDYKIKSFDIPYGHTTSLKNDIFFDQILEKPNWFSTNIKL